MIVSPERPNVEASPQPGVPTLIAAFIQDHVRSDRPVLIGLCGPQGAGKSTACDNARRLLEKSGLTTLPLSLDDFYLHRQKRLERAAATHPLFKTRGVPGRPTPIPSFDKSLDDVRPSDHWILSPAHLDVILLEGWCVGARPQSSHALQEAANALEANEDPFGV